MRDDHQPVRGTDGGEDRDGHLQLSAGNRPDGDGDSPAFGLNFFDRLQHLLIANDFPQIFPLRFVRFKSQQPAGGIVDEQHLLFEVGGNDAFAHAFQYRREFGFVFGGLRKQRAEGIRHRIQASGQ